MRILVVENNRRLSSRLKMSLRDNGYEVDVAYDGGECQKLAEATPYDLIVLDLNLPGRDGIKVCEELRMQKINTPILMLTPRDAIEDDVKVLDSGADDFLAKPFGIADLIAHMRALLQRESPDRPRSLKLADLTLDPAMHLVSRAGVFIHLTAKEFSFLEYIMRNPNRLITREMAENHVWTYDYNGASNVVDVYIRRLRRKIDEPFEPKLIETVRGAGYRMRNPNQ